MRRDVLDRLADEIKKAHLRKDTVLRSRLQEAKREIAYFREIIDDLCMLEDKHLPRSFRVFADLTRKGQKAGMAHPLFSPEGISIYSPRYAARRAEERAKKPKAREVTQ